MFVMKMLEVTSDLKWGDSWQGREIFNTNICTLRMFERLLSWWYICIYRRSQGCAINTSQYYEAHHITSQHENQFFHLQPDWLPSDQQVLRWEIEIEECRKLPSSSSRGSSTWHPRFTSLQCPTHLSTWTLLGGKCDQLKVVYFILSVWVP